MNNKEMFEKFGYCKLQIFDDPNKCKPYEDLLLNLYKEDKLDDCNQVKNSKFVYNNNCLKKLHVIVKNRIQEETGLDLYMTYNFARVYFNGNVLDPHYDRPACEISVTMNIGGNADWSIYFLIDNEEKEICLKPNEAIAYKGCDLLHWRYPFECDENEYLCQCFFHNVIKNGKYDDYKYDTKFKSEEDYLKGV